MGHNSVISGQPKSTGIPRVDGLSTGPPDLGYYIYLFVTITMLHNLTTVVGLVAVQYRILDQMEMMKTVQIKKVMMNTMKMLMMNVMEMMGMLKLIDMHHPFELLTKFWKMNKGYMSLHKHHLVMYQITQMMRH